MGHIKNYLGEDFEKFRKSKSPYGDYGERSLSERLAYLSYNAVRIKELNAVINLILDHLGCEVVTHPKKTVLKKKKSKN